MGVGWVSMDAVVVRLSDVALVSVVELEVSVDPVVVKLSRGAGGHGGTSSASSCRHLG